MNNQNNYEAAKRNAAKKLGFYIHSIVYASVIALLILINLLTSPGTLWFIWPMMGWGIGLSIHGAAILLVTGSVSIMGWMTQRELQLQVKRHLR